MKATEKPTVIRVRKMTLRDHAAALALWQKTEGMGMSGADSRAGIALFLRRNPGLSYVAVAGKALIGAVLCGHDGRRGFLYHLAVDKAHRQRGLGKSLALKSLAELRKRGIQKCHIVVYAHNLEGQNFWQKIGWEKRDNLLIMSKSPGT